MITADGKNLIFIFSLPRSGSTMLSAILANNSRVYCPPEPWVLLRLAEVYGEGSSEKVFDDLVASSAVREFLSEETFCNSARAFALQAYNEALQKAKKDVLVDKTPRYYHILPFIDALFPKARKIWLKRNPMDVAASYKDTWSIGADIISGEEVGPHTLDFLVGLENLVAYFDAGSSYKYEIRYEDIVTRSREEIMKLASFCGLPFEENMVDIYEDTQVLSNLTKSELGDKKIMGYRGLHADSVGRWKTMFTPDEAHKIQSFIGGDIFSRMGYSDMIAAGPTEERIRPQGGSGKSVAARLAEKLHVERLARIEHIREQALELGRRDEYIRTQAQELKHRDEYIR